MEVLYACGCGIEVHAKMLVACLRKQGKKDVRPFSTMTADLVRVLKWLVVAGCMQVAIESTGVYWRPVFNILKGALDVSLTKARDAKGFTARKTDGIEAEGLADLLRPGLFKPSFIPPRPIREVREWTRYRDSRVRGTAGQVFTLSLVRPLRVNYPGAVHHVTAESETSIVGKDCSVSVPIQLVTFWLNVFLPRDIGAIRRHCGKGPTPA